MKRRLSSCFDQRSESQRSLVRVFGLLTQKNGWLCKRLPYHRKGATETRRRKFDYIERFYKRASQHPSVYVIEENRLC